MSTVPKLTRWSIFVRGLGGRVGLDMAWEERAWAEFADDRDGPLDVVCRLTKDGDLDVETRPRLEGENIRDHARLQQALAAFAYVNPARSGEGAPVRQERHRGEWHRIDDDLSVAVAVDGEVGGVDVGGRGAFLIFKDQLWLPHGAQEPKPWPDAAKSADRSGTQVEPSRDAVGTTSGPAPDAADAETDGGNVRVLPRADQKRPKERAARIFGNETDELIHQARSAGRRRA